MRKILLLWATLFCAVPVLAQSTSLTINVTDAGSQTWNNGTYTLTFVGAPNAKWSGGNLATSFTGTLGSTGSVTVSIPDVNTITPGPSYWSVQVCPNSSVSAGPTGCYRVQPASTITGSTQTLNVTPPAISIVINQTSMGVVAYSTSEITSVYGIGAQFYLIGTGLQLCTAVTGTTCTTWSSSGGTQTIASGTAALGTSSIASGTCASTVTVTATGVATTDNIMADFNASPLSTVGYSPSASGMLTIIKWPTAGNVNFAVCNNTGAAIVPGAVTLNWRVVR
jgi:hypothetical protein